MIKMTIRNSKLDIREDIVWAAYDLDGNRTAQGTTYGTIATPAQLAEWDAIAPAVIDAILATEDAPAPVRRQTVRVGRYGTCDPADCDGNDCDGDCSYDSLRPASLRDREYVADELRW